MSDDHEIGYGKPPKRTRFKKGQSGNPKGRPKGRKNMQTIVTGIMDRQVTITDNGRTRQVKFLEAFVHQIAAKALNGSTRDQIMIIKALNDYAPELLKEPDVPQGITVTFVRPKDGRPDWGGEGEDPDNQGQDTDDRSFLD